MPFSLSKRTHCYLLLALLLAWMAPLLHRHQEHPAPVCAHGDALHLEAAAAESQAAECPVCRSLGRPDAAPAAASSSAEMAGVAPAATAFRGRPGAAPFLGSGGARAPPAGG